MSTYSKVIQDSVSEQGIRVITLELSFPRLILPEINTYRMAARNTASSRAVPLHKRLSSVRSNPFIPNHWGKNQPGMSAREEVDPQTQNQAKGIWEDLIEYTAKTVENLQKLGIHKQTASRPLDTFSYTKQIYTTTELSNLLWQRCHPDAQPEFMELAYMMADAAKASQPRLVKPGDWHLPYVTELERASLPLEIAIECCVARCARVSYENHDSNSPVIEKDRSTFSSLVTNGHFSPLEHSLTPVEPTERHGPFTGWKSYRQTIPNENRTNYPGIIGL